MNSIQRVQATLSGLPVDRRAYTAVLSLYGAKLTQCSLKTYYEDPRAYAKGQMAVWETFRPDIMFGPFNFADIGAAFGAERHFFDVQPPIVKRPAYNAVSEWGQHPLPDPDSNPKLSFYSKAIQSLTNQIKNEVLVVGCLPPPIDIPPLLFGAEAWMETIVTEPERAQTIMEDLIPFFVRLAASIYQAGAVAIAIPCGYVSPHIVPRKMVQRLMLPILTKAFNSLKGAVILHHGGGPILAHLDLLFSLPNVIAVLIDPRDSIASTRNLIGNQQTLITGLMAPRFLDFTSHQIEEGCEKVLEACRMDRRFILANAGPDLPWNTPIENILAMRRVVERWGPLK